MNSTEVGNKILQYIESKKSAVLKAIGIEAEISIRKNFEAGGRPTWIPRKHISKRQQGTNILVISGALKNVSAVTDASGNKVTIVTDPRARAYAKIQHEGGTIDMPGRTHRFRKNKAGRIVFASSKHKRIVKEVQGGAYKIVIPARPFMVIPPDDYPRIISVAKEAFK